MEQNSEQSFRNQKFLDKNPKLIIDSLRDQIKKIPQFNKFHSFKQKIKDISQDKSHINNIADKIRNTIINNDNENCNLNLLDNDIFSPLRKKSKNLEDSYLKHQISSYNKLKTEKINSSLHYINKLRQEKIKQINSVSCDVQEQLFPVSYTPISSITFLNLQELSLMMSLFYSNIANKNEKCINFVENIELVFLTIDEFNLNNYSVIVTGKLTYKLDEKYLFSAKNTCACKLVLSPLK